jgi:hypothetical protein
MNNDKQLREELAGFLAGGKAHMTVAEAVKDFPLDQINNKPQHVDYTFWHLLEHIRFTQFDIVDFIKNPEYKEPHWPNDYWPEKTAKATEETWHTTIKKFEADLQDMISIVKNPDTDLYARIPNGDGQTVLREALLIIDHNAYHLGEFAILRQVEKNWKK